MSGNKKILAIISLFVGFGFGVLLSVRISPEMTAQNPTTFIASAAQTMPASSYSIASLPGSPALKNRFIKAFEATNGKCRARDVSMKAQAPPAEWIQNWEDRTSGSGALASLDPGFENVDIKLMASGKTAPLSKEAVMDMPGVTAPLGIFDPLGISTKVPEGQLLFYREAELKHGRVCMMAVLGLIVAERQDFITFLGNGIEAKAPAYLLGGPYVQETSLAQFWPFAIAALFAEEARREYTRKQNPDALPGDYGWDPLGLKPKDPKAFKEMQNKELNNGRLAMFASAGIIAQEMVEGKDILPAPLLSKFR